LQLFDIAILTIDPPISYSKVISPVCLPPASTAVDQFSGKDAAIMGWGALKSGKKNYVLNFWFRIISSVYEMKGANLSDKIPFLIAVFLFRNRNAML
jgi:hypothetical protein